MPLWSCFFPSVTILNFLVRIWCHSHACVYTVIMYVYIHTCLCDFMTICNIRCLEVLWYWKILLQLVIFIQHYVFVIFVLHSVRLPCQILWKILEIFFGISLVSSGKDWLSFFLNLFRCFSLSFLHKVL